MAVCEKTFELLMNGPYRDSFIGIEPYEAIPLDQAPLFDCEQDTKRHPRETKGRDFNKTLPTINDCCGGDSTCC